MNALHGIAASRGIAIGPAFQFRRADLRFERHKPCRRWCASGCRLRTWDKPTPLPMDGNLAPGGSPDPPAWQQDLTILPERRSETPLPVDRQIHRRCGRI